jgi:hypothetical protein
MLATARDVLEMTGYTAGDSDVRKAQAIVEVFAGRTEALITLPKDREWMKYAICWQVAYMSSDGNAVYEQANVASLSQNETRIDFGDKSYAVAPLVVKTIEHLSWRRSRGIDTRPWFDREPTYDSWVTD